MVRKCAPCDFSPFTFTGTCFMAQHKVYLGECSIYTWKNFVLLFLPIVFCKCQFDQTGYSFVFCVLTEFMYTCSINYWKRNIEVFNLCLWIVYSPFKSVVLAFLYFEAFLLSEFTFNIVTSSWCIYSLIIIKYSSCSLFWYLLSRLLM